MEDKIYLSNSLNNFSKKIKRLKKKIVLCHGVFDIFHIGHLDYFYKSKKFGDILIVSITDDSYIVNKGTNRPVFNSLDRAELLASLSIVDYVIINKSKTSVSLIKKLKPDFYCKGKDYKNFDEDLTGNITREFNAVKSIGGQFKSLSGRVSSSTKLLKILSSHVPINKNQVIQKFIDKLKLKFSLEDIIDSIKHFEENFTILGELIFDNYYNVEVLGKSGKEPILNYTIKDVDRFVGGSFLIFSIVRLFLNNANLITFFNKRDSKKILSKFKKDIINVDNFKKSIKKNRYIDNYSKQKFFGIYETTDKNTIPKSFYTDLKKKILMKSHDNLICIDYGHGIFNDQIIKLIKNLKSKFKSINVQLNSDSYITYDIFKYTDFDYLCLQESEIRLACRNNLKNIETLMTNVYKKLNLRFLVVTKGNQGAVMLSKNGFFYAPPFGQKIIDRVGAGDAFYSISAILLAKNIHEDIVLFLSSISAKYMVENLGTENSKLKDHYIKEAIDLYD